jgi:hypothetical protein
MSAIIANDADKPLTAAALLEVARWVDASAHGGTADAASGRLAREGPVPAAGSPSELAAVELPHRALAALLDIGDEVGLSDQGDHRHDLFLPVGGA